jgi:hypothetical protein
MLPRLPLNSWTSCLSPQPTPTMGFLGMCHHVYLVFCCFYINQFIQICTANLRNYHHLLFLGVLGIKPKALHMLRMQL